MQTSLDWLLAQEVEEDDEVEEEEEVPVVSPCARGSKKHAKLHGVRYI